MYDILIVEFGSRGAALATVYPHKLGPKDREIWQPRVIFGVEMSVDKSNFHRTTNVDAARDQAHHGDTYINTNSKITFLFYHT
jgi:hypothetical protein